MVRSILFRLPIFRGFPRAAAPLLPLRRGPLLGRTAQSRLFQHFPARLTTPPSSPSQLQEHQTLSQRLRVLIKSYGWYALGVYAVISALDFGVAFVGINLLGADQVSRFVASVREMIAGLLSSKPPEPGREGMVIVKPGDHSGHEGLYAMLVLAYTVHKTVFLPVRVGLTAALTPKLVGWLRQRGWAGGEGTRRAATEIRERLRRGSRG